MRRQVFRRTTQGMALFPFLAVLICTMGALIVLLVMILQQARVNADAASQQQSDEEQRQAVADRAARQAERERGARESHKLREQQEDLEWQREILAKQREQQLAELAKSRLELSHLEDHLRRLEDQAKQMAIQVTELERPDESKASDRASAQGELDKLRAAIAQAQRELDAARKKASQGPRSFAIIPYQGPNGTRRRPIYIECAEEGIVLHPENIVLQPNDFNGPLGPGNPLAACLNALREYITKYGDPRDGEPYPLLVVRPNGAVAYAMARAAMKSWEDEFGYELIDGEMKLTFPPADPALENLLLRTIKDARSRQEILAAAMPSRYKDEGLGFVASGNRGFVADDEFPSASGRGPGNGAGGLGNGQGQGPPGSPASFGPRGSRDRASESAKMGAKEGPPAGSQSRTKGGAKAGTQGDPKEGSHENAQSSADASSDAPRGSTDGQKSGAKSDATPDIASSFGGTSPNSAASLARSKGPDWALPNKSSNSTGITRPIRVQCLSDRLVILPERGDSRRPTVILLKSSPRASTEECVAEIWKKMEDWGIAVAGGYWKPVLKVEVGPGAERQFAEFESLLRGSGLEVQRK